MTKLKCLLKTNKNVLLVNNNIKNCGVYQYGKRIGDICLKSKIIKFKYVEISSSNELFSFIEEINPDVIIYNYVPSNMSWLNFDILECIRNKNIKQGNIIHNAEYSGFDFYLHQNPYYHSSDENNFTLLRPLFDYIPAKDFKKDEDVIKIGTFGFGGNHKFVHEICRLVNEEFTDDNVQLNLHITKNWVSLDIFEEVKNQCIDTITNQNIKLNITNEFLSNQKMLDFLYNNDLNIFFYENYSFYNGISSTIDYAMSVKKPIAICKSNMFSHIMDVQPSICVEDIDLHDIIKNGFSPLQEKYDSWTTKKFLNKMEQIIEKVV